MSTREAKELIEIVNELVEEDVCAEEEEISHYADWCNERL